MDYREILERVIKLEPIAQRIIRLLCKKVIELLSNQSNLQPVSAPVKVVGDVHGQFFDVLKMLAENGNVPDVQYLFIGDYVDRGYNSLQTILMLYCFKILYPDRIYLTRGNHQSRQISCMYGFYEETIKKYGNPNVWKYFNQTFDYLPLGAIINDQIFCVHGGLSPDIHSLDQIRQIERDKEIPTAGPFADLMWSDPEEIDGWALNTRGAGWMFGESVANEFSQKNRLKLIVRAHQLAQQGYFEWFSSKSVVTVWSAPNYGYRCNNLASVMEVNEQAEWKYNIYEADERSKESTHYSKLIPYFL